MKSRLFSTLFLLTAGICLVAPPLAAAPTHQCSPHAFPVSAVLLPSTGTPIVAPGSSVTDVARNLGQPYKKITPNHWVYYSCRPELPARNWGCDILLVELRDGRIAAMKFVNPRALAVTTTCMQTRRNVLYVAAN